MDLEVLVNDTNVRLSRAEPKDHKHQEHKREDQEVFLHAEKVSEFLADRCRERPILLYNSGIMAGMIADDAIAILVTQASRTSRAALDHTDVFENNGGRFAKGGNGDHISVMQPPAVCFL